MNLSKVPAELNHVGLLWRDSMCRTLNFDLSFFVYQQIWSLPEAEWPKSCWSTARGDYCQYIQLCEGESKCKKRRLAESDCQIYTRICTEDWSPLE